jgi:hypothetical protein
MFCYFVFCYFDDVMTCVEKTALLSGRGAPSYLTFPSDIPQGRFEADHCLFRRLVEARGWLTAS